MRRNDDLDKLERLRQSAQDASRMAAEKVRSNQYISPKAAGALLAGTVALAALATPVAAISLGAAAGLTVGTAAVVAIVAAGLNIAKATGMEAVRNEYAGFSAKVSEALNDITVVYDKVKQDFMGNRGEAFHTVNADFYDFRQEIELGIELKSEQEQAEQLQARSNQGQRQSSDLKADSSLSMG